MLLSWLVLERGCGLPVDRGGEGEGIGADMPGIPGPDPLLGLSDMYGTEAGFCNQLEEEGRGRAEELGCADQGCMNWDPCQ